MDNLLSGLKRLAELFEKYQKICEAPAFSKNRLALEKVITPLIIQLEDMELEHNPLYSEIESLIFLKKGNKFAVSEAFMKDFAQKELNTKFAVKKGKPKESRKEFINLATKACKLEVLKTFLDPEKPIREAFTELMRLDMKEIEKRIKDMKTPELTRMLEVKHIEFKKTDTGKFSKKSYPEILSQLQNIKNTELLHQ